MPLENRRDLRSEEFLLRGVNRPDNGRSQQQPKQ